MSVSKRENLIAALSIACLVKAFSGAAPPEDRDKIEKDFNTAWDALDTYIRELEEKQ